MYIPTGLVLVLVLWLLTKNDTRPLPGWLCALGLVAFAVYAPEAALLFLALAAVVAVPFLLVLGGIGALCGLSWLANALPDWRIFRAPAPKPELAHPIAVRSDLVAIPLLLGLAAAVIWLCARAA